MSEKKIHKEKISYFDRDIIGKDKEIVRLYDRQGKLIKETIQTGMEWKGLYNGEPCVKEHIEIFYFYNHNGELKSTQTIDLLNATQERNEYINGKIVKRIYEDENQHSWVSLYTYDSIGQTLECRDYENFKGLVLDNQGRFDTYKGNHYEYDEHNHLINIYNEEDCEYTHEFIYDRIGRLITEVFTGNHCLSFINYDYIGNTEHLYRKTWWERWNYDIITRIEVYDEYCNRDAERNKFIDGEVGRLKEYLKEVHTFGKVNCVEKYRYNENGDCILKTITKGADTHTEEILCEYNEDGICTYCVNLWTVEGYSRKFEYFED